MNSTPVNLLALDGGGVRGISELRILQIIMDRLKARLRLPDDADDPLPCEYFQLIGGTSTGGLIAIMLSRLRMTAVEAAEQYNELAKKIFGPQNKKCRVQDGAFKATTLKEAVEKLVATRAEASNSGTSMIPTGKGTGVDTKCFVCALEASNTRFPELLRSYPATGRDAIKCEIWEAARATSAAPTFFKEISIKIPGGTALRFVDGGLRCNNPATAIIDEAEKVFGGDRPVGCIVSLGCGLKSAIGIKKPSGYQKILPVSLLKALGDIATDCQDTADATAKRFRTRPDVYYRFNATNIGDLSLAEWESMDEMVSHTRSYCKDPRVSDLINHVVEILYASRGKARERESGALTLAQILSVPSDAKLRELSFHGIQKSKGESKRTPEDTEDAYKSSAHDLTFRIMSADYNASWPTGNQPDPLFMVPSPKDSHFTGRESIMDLINTKFKTERRVALTGIGGVGKTQIAIEYCHRFRQDHPAWNILWVYASNIGRFEQSFQEIARRLGLPGWDDAAINTLELVSDWLNSGEPWLTVIDNADNQDVFFPQQLETTLQNPSAHTITPLSKYLPQTSSTGLTLITSRARDAAYCLTNSDENIVHVPLMDKADAMALLCRKMKGMSDPCDRSNDMEKAELVERLDCLPLAITQATSYIIVRKRTMTISKYSKYLEKNESILLARVPDSRRDPAYPNSVLLTWQISFNQINEDNEPAAKLLSFMSILDRQGIPRFLLQGDDEDDLDFENRLDPLIAFSLISVDEDAQSFQMHRLVQIAVQSWLEKDKYLDQFKKQALEVIAMNLPNTRWHLWETWDSLLPHAQLALGYAYPDRKIQLLHAEILQATAKYLGVYGKHDLAVERCKRAFDIHLDLLGEGDDRTAESIVEMRHLERELAYSTRSEDSPRSVSREAMLRRMVGNLHEGEALERVRLELARSLLRSQDDKNLNEATEILQSLVKSQQDPEGIMENVTLHSMMNLARVYRKRGRVAEAADLVQVVLDTELEMYYENDPRISWTMNSMAVLMLEMNKTKEAYEFSKRCLDLRIMAFGEENTNTLSAMRRLAAILTHWASQDETKHQEAYEFCRRTLNLHTHMLGDQHDYTLRCTEKFARALELQKEYEEVERLSREVVRIIVDVPEDPSTITEMMTLV